MTVPPLTPNAASSRPAPPRPPLRIPHPAPGTRPARSSPRCQAASSVLLVLFGQDRPASGLRRAVALAQTLDAKLHVLCVLPPLRGVEAIFSRRRMLNVARAVEQNLSATRATRSWLADVLRDEDVVERVAIARGKLIEQAAAHAATIDATLIILPGGEGRMGKKVTSLARAASTPVFVARESFSGKAIVAATDLRRSGYPVLWTAAELGRRTRASMVAVHNVVRERRTGADMDRVLGVSRAAIVHAATADRLSQIAERLPIETKTVVRIERNPADAVLDEARSYDADFVVVGTRSRHWCERLIRASVATQIVNRARSSVLVLPLEERAPSHHSQGRPEHDERVGQPGTFSSGVAVVQTTRASGWRLDRSNPGIAPSVC